LPSVIFAEIPGPEAIETGITNVTPFCRGTVTERDGTPCV
jgi:hypothetical protein